MNNKKQYRNKKEKLLKDNSINDNTRKGWKIFFEFEENKLKRVNNLSSLDSSTYKTLIEYCSRLRTVNKFFKNKDWNKITKEDIKKVWNDLEDGKIKNRFKKPYKNKRTYYNKIMKSKPFDIFGKKELAKEVIEFPSREEGEVSYILNEDFKKLPSTASRIDQQTLLWLAWDFGENISAILQTEKRDFTRQVNETTKEPEYRINLRKEILKRSRRPRGLLTNFQETVEFLDIILKNLKDNDKLFTFGYRQALKFFVRLVKDTKIKTLPNKNKPTWKDLRSGMSCYLLKEGWNREEINSRLGHRPSSSEIDKYITFLALEQRRPKKKLIENEKERMIEEIENLKKSDRLTANRHEEVKERLNNFEGLIEMFLEKSINENDKHKIEITSSSGKQLKPKEIVSLMFNKSKI